MSEKNLWKWLSGILPEGQYNRIESHDTCAGFPDVHWQIPGTCNTNPRSGTFELKHSHNVRGVPFKGDKDGLHLSQRKWIRDNIEAGGLCWIIAEVRTQILVIHGCRYDRFNGSTISELRSISDQILHRDCPEIAAKIMKKLMSPEDQY